MNVEKVVVLTIGLEDSTGLKSKPHGHDMSSSKPSSKTDEDVVVFRAVRMKPELKRMPKRYKFNNKGDVNATLGNLPASGTYFRELTPSSPRRMRASKMMETMRKW